MTLIKNNFLLQAEKRVYLKDISVNILYTVEPV
jgi:hypothetical protein